MRIGELEAAGLDVTILLGRTYQEDREGYLHSAPEECDIASRPVKKRTLDPEAALCLRCWKWYLPESEAAEDILRYWSISELLEEEDPLALVRASIRIFEMRNAPVRARLAEKIEHLREKRCGTAPAGDHVAFLPVMRTLEALREMRPKQRREVLRYWRSEHPEVIVLTGAGRALEKVCESIRAHTLRGRGTRLGRLDAGETAVLETAVQLYDQHNPRLENAAACLEVARQVA